MYVIESYCSCIQKYLQSHKTIHMARRTLPVRKQRKANPPGQALVPRAVKTSQPVTDDGMMFVQLCIQIDAIIFGTASILNPG